MKKILTILLAGAMLAGCVLTGCSDSSSSKSDSSDGNTAKVADPIEGVKATASTDKYRNYYEIFVNSFCDSNGDETGDLQGIISQLDYLNDGDPNSGDDLGVDAIWLTPIMPSKSYHKYDVEDYYNIDPDFGTLDDFDKLIEECHKRGINVILDLVLNHASSKNPLFTKAVEEVADNKLDGNAEYFEIHKSSYFETVMPVRRTFLRRCPNGISTLKRREKNLQKLRNSGLTEELTASDLTLANTLQIRKPTEQNFSSGSTTPARALRKMSIWLARTGPMIPIFRSFTNPASTASLHLSFQPQQAQLSATSFRRAVWLLPKKL